MFKKLINSHSLSKSWRSPESSIFRHIGRFSLVALMLAMTVSSFAQSIVYSAGPDKGETGVADLSFTNQYFQGFEVDAAWGGDPTRVASGTGGITSRTGGFHAQAVAGNFTRFGGYSSVFPSLGFTTSVDVYFDMAGGYSNDTRFAYTSAASQPNGDHRRDFVFSCGFYSDGPPYGSGNRFVCSASNNAPGWPKDPGRSPVFVNTTGWYTLKHTFRNNGGVLAVDMVLLDSVGGVKGTWTLSDPTDIIGTTVGGNRYGWFQSSAFPFLAIDNSRRDNIIPSSTVKVTPVNYNGWLFYDDFADVTNNSLGSFVTGPATPALGSGSAQVSVTGSDRVNLATYQFSGTPLADINELKFRTYNPSAGNGGSPTTTSFLVFNVDFNGSDTWQQRLVFVPSGVTQDNWKEWDAIAGGNALWGYSRNTTWPLGVGGGGEPSGNTPGAVLKTWSQILSQYPGVRMRVTDSHLGIRVGNPDPLGYTENIDSFTLGTATSTTTFDFDPAPLLVDDDLVECPTAGFSTIQAAINAASPGATVSVCAGTYTEDVTVNKAGLTLVGAGIDVSTIIGPHTTGGGDTVLISAPNVTVDGFTITRTGNTDVPLGSWAANTQNQGVNVAASTGVTIQNSKLTGNRNGIYVGQSSNNVTIRRNNITFNRTGVHLVDNHNALIEENFITNNWTMGVLYRDEVPLGGPDPTGVVVRNNNISGNWYSQMEFREPAGTSIMNMSGNYLGTTSPTRVTTTSLEPGYTAQIPAAYPGGSAVAPGSPTGTIAGPESSRIDYSPFLSSSVDTQPLVPGFQGDFSSVVVNTDSASSSGALSNVQDGINLVSTGGTVTALAGTYNGNVIVNKAATLKGDFTINGTFSTSNTGAVVSPGNSPGIINSGNLSLNSGATLNMEINGITPGTFHDQLNVTGTVSLGSATLNVTTGYAPGMGDSMVIVNNDGADAVTGTFAGLPNLATFIVSGTTFQINYAGGSGNDVVLTVVTLTCDALATNNVSTLTGVPITIPVNSTTDLTGRGVISADFTFTYDSADLTLVNVTAGPASNGGSVVIFTSPGTIVISVVNAAGFTGTGALVNVNFNVIGTIGATSPLALSGILYNGGMVCVDPPSNGTLTIISGTVSGQVTYGNSPGPVIPVRGVDLNAPGAPTVTATTDALGNYSMSGFGPAAYTITPSKTAYPVGTSIPAHGIFADDATDIVRSVVGLDPPLTGSRLAAARVAGNLTPALSSFEAALISQWIVAISSPINQTGQWKFTPGSNGPTVFNANATHNYTGILMGDVNQSWSNMVGSRQALTAPTKDSVLPSITSMEAERGREVTVPFRIDNLGDKMVGSYQFDIEYDPSVIEPVALASDIAGTRSEGMTILSNSPEEGLLKVAAYSAFPVSGDGVYVYLKFRTIGAVGSTTQVTIKEFRFNDGSDEVFAKGGRVSVTREADATGVKGRVISALGQPISNARVTLTATDGTTRTTVTSSLGSYEFSGLATGETYTVTVQSKKFTFEPRSVSMTGSPVDLDMIARQ